MTVLSHPPFGGVYGPSESCTWTIPGEPGLYTVLNVTYATESCCDHVYVYSGTDVVLSALVRTLSGSGHSQIISSTAGSAFTIRFSSDGSVQGTGFVMRISRQQMPPQMMCPNGLVVSTSMTSLQYPTFDGYTANDDCRWVVPGLSGLYTALSVEAQLYTYSDCVSIFDGNSISATLLRTFCARVLPLLRVS